MTYECETHLDWELNLVQFENCCKFLSKHSLFPQLCFCRGLVGKFSNGWKMKLNTPICATRGEGIFQVDGSCWGLSSILDSLEDWTRFPTTPYGFWSEHQGERFQFYKWKASSKIGYWAGEDSSSQRRNSFLHCFFIMTKKPWVRI